MANSTVWVLPAIATIFIFLASFHAEARQVKQIYVVYLKGRTDTPDIDPESKSAHLRLLSKVLETSTPKEALIYSYKIINAFAAKLTLREAKKIAKRPEVLFVTESRRNSIHDPQMPTLSTAGKIDDIDELSPSNHKCETEICLHN